MKFRHLGPCLVFCVIFLQWADSASIGATSGGQELQPASSQQHFLEICRDGNIFYDPYADKACRQYLVSINRHQNSTKTAASGQKNKKVKGQKGGQSGQNMEKNPLKRIVAYWKNRMKMFMERMSRGLSVISTKVGDFTRNFFKNIQYYYEEFEKGIKEGSYDRDK